MFQKFLNEGGPKCSTSQTKGNVGQYELKDASLWFFQSLIKTCEYCLHQLLLLSETVGKEHSVILPGAHIWMQLLCIPKLPTSVFSSSNLSTI